MRALCLAAAFLAAANVSAEETQIIWKLVKVTRPVQVQTWRWVEEEYTFHRWEHIACAPEDRLRWDPELGAWVSYIGHRPIYQWVRHTEKRKVFRPVTEWREITEYKRVPEKVPIPEERTTMPHPGQ